MSECCTSLGISVGVVDGQPARLAFALANHSLSAIYDWALFQLFH